MAIAFASETAPERASASATGESLVDRPADERAVANAVVPGERAFAMEAIARTVAA